MRVYTFLDLDDTLFQTLPKCPPDEPRRQKQKALLFQPGDDLAHRAFADAVPKGKVMFVSNTIKVVGCLMMLFGTHPLAAYAIVGLGASVAVGAAVFAAVVSAVEPGLLRYAFRQTKRSLGRAPGPAAPSEVPVG